MIKKGTILLFIALTGFSVTNYGQGQQQGAAQKEIPTAPEGYRRPEGYDPVKNRYQYSLMDLKNRFSEKMIRDAEKEYGRISEVNCGGKWKPVGTSLDRHVAPEWFEDAKFGMFVDWGLWSAGGWAVKRDKGAMYPDWYEHRIDHDAIAEEYHDKNWGKDFQRDDLIPFFKDENYSPDKLTDIAAAAGMKYIIPFCKHHSGFCLWPSSYTHRDAGDRMGKDLIRPLADNCKNKGLKFGFYFSTEEWEYPVINTKGELIIREWAGKYKPYEAKYETLASGKIAVNDYVKDYIVPQAVEFIDKYDPDILWYDGEWNSPVEILGCYDIAAYFYNKAEGKKEVAVNDRYGLINGKRSRSFRGDVFTSEYGDMTDDNRLRHTWEENRGISQSFGFNWQDTDKNVITSKEFIDMFVNIVSKGGNLLLIVNLDAKGALPDIQEKRLLDIGKWLKINGEGIYNTRSCSVTAEDSVRYTRSKDNKTVFAISLAWPGKQLKLKSVEPAKNSEIYMLGYNEPLKWSRQNGTTIISLPAKLQKEKNRPCDYAYIFKIRK